MGLDMYLYKKHYVKNWEHDKPEEKKEVSVKIGGETPNYIKPERIREVTEEVAYWRKANQIHAWFVQHIQSGVDNCADHYVSREDLGKLLKEVELTLTARHLAPELLPTQEGFFFGSKEYDEYYWADLEDTKKILTELLQEPVGGDFYYSSSW